MPKRKRTVNARRRRSKKHRRRSYRGRRKLSVMRAPAGLPTQNVVKMRYFTYGTLSVGGGGFGAVYFRANGLNDPEVALGGHQPMGHDIMGQMYNRYIVLGSKIWVKLCNGTSTPMVVGIYLNDNQSVADANWETLVESKKGTNKLLCENTRAVTVRSKFSCRKFFGVKDVRDNKGTLGANFGADPSNGAYFTLWSSSVDKISAYSATFTCVIDYIVFCSEPKDQPQN